MTCRISLRFGVLVLLGTVCSSRLAFALSQGCVDRAPPSRVPVQETKISIVGVEFQDENPLSDELRVQLVKDIQQQERWVTPEGPDSSWVDDALFPIKDELRKQGYFQPYVVGTPYLVRALASERRYILRVVIESGPKYRLGKIKFASVSNTPLAFTEALLRQQIALQEGEPFNVPKIRDGIEAIGKLYNSKGYIDATPEPDSTIDEEGS